MIDRDSRHGNRLDAYKPPVPVDIRKVPADSVPYGTSISRNGKHVYGAYDINGQLVCVAATAGEARRKYKSLTAKGMGGGSKC